MNKQVNINTKKRLQELAGIHELKSVSTRRDLKREIQRLWPDIVEWGKIETGTEEWMFILELALEIKAGIKMPKGEEIFDHMDGENVVRALEKDNWKIIRDVEEALTSLGVEII